MIVVDASAIVSLLTDTPAPHRIGAELAADELAAPELLDYEVAAALRGHILGGKIAELDAVNSLTRFRELTIERYAALPFLDRILELRDNFSSYDAAYIALAQGLAAPLITADRKLLEAERFGIEVRVVRD